MRTADIDSSVKDDITVNDQRHLKIYVTMQVKYVCMSHVLSNVISRYHRSTFYNVPYTIGRFYITISNPGWGEIFRTRPNRP
jgi:hypothetical protein